MDKVVVAEAARTPFGKFGEVLAMFSVIPCDSVGLLEVMKPLTPITAQAAGVSSRFSRKMWRWSGAAGCWR